MTLRERIAKELYEILMRYQSWENLPDYTKNIWLRKSDKILDLIESELLDEKSFRSLSSSMEQNKWHRLGFLEIIDLIKTKLREGR